MIYRAIPICVLSTAFIMLWVDQASARSWSDIILEQRGILTSPHTIQDVTNHVQTWVQIGNDVSSVIDWIKNLPRTLPVYSIQLLSNVFNMLSDLILQTPLFIFDNSVIRDKTLVFSGISVLIVIVMTALNGIKQMLKKRHTNVKDISSRFGLAVIASGFAPFLFKMAFSGLNFISVALNKLTSNEMTHIDFLGKLDLGYFDTACLLGFDLVTIALLIPVFLQAGKRWFDLLCLSAVTPLAFSAYVFNETKHYFHEWLDNIIVKGRTQIIYSFFIFMMSVFIFGTTGITDPSGIIVKMLITLGGLMTLANPPRFVLAKTDHGETIDRFGKDVKKSAQNIYKTLTFNKMKTARSIIKKFRGK